MKPSGPGQLFWASGVPVFIIVLGMSGGNVWGAFVLGVVFGAAAFMLGWVDERRGCKD